MKIVADVHIPFLETYFGGHGEIVMLPGRSITADVVQDADILLVRSITKVDASLLQSSSVKFVGSVTAGTDHLDLAWLEKAGISCAIAHGFNAPPVADYVVSVVAAMQKNNMMPVEHLTAAIIGVGKVGKLVSERLNALGIKTILCDPIRAEQEPDFISVPIETIENVDLVCLHVPLTKTGNHPTQHMIERHFLSRQKPGCVLLNASRGAVIDSRALMQHGKHLHWCFDVWEHEPNIDSAVLQHAAIATSHIAGYSAQSKMRGIEMIYQAACEKNIIPRQALEHLTMPRQRLSFAGNHLDWRDIVLGIFNPLVMTTMMRSLFAAAKDHGEVFDKLRNDFTYRHEFGSVDIGVEANMDNCRPMLKMLGVNL